MACYTMIEVNLEDSALNRKARKNLGLTLTGSLTEVQAKRVMREAATLKGMEAARRLDPRAIVRRKGNKLTITVQR